MKKLFYKTQDQKNSTFDSESSSPNKKLKVSKFYFKIKRFIMVIKNLFYWFNSKALLNLQFDRFY
jgi:hypothetical protein